MCLFLFFPVNRPEERSLFPSTRSVVLRNLPCKDMNSNEMKNNLSDMINDVLGLHLFTAGIYCCFDVILVFIAII